MRKLAILLKKEFLQIFRDKFLLRVVILIPIFQLLVLPLAADYDLENFRLAVIDRDGSSFSRRLLTKIQAGGYFSTTAAAASWAEAERMIEQGQVDAIVEIPDRFERDWVMGQGPEISVHISAIDGLSAGVAAGYLNSIAGEFRVELVAERLLPAAASTDETTGRPPVRIETVVQEWYNPRFNYKTVIVPGILAMLLTVVGLSMMASNAVREKEYGTIEQLNVTPMSRTRYMLAKMIPFIVIGFVQFTVGLVIARTVYAVPLLGSVGVLYGIVALYLAGVLFLGFVIANFSETQGQTIFPAFFLIMILVLMSGLFTPVESMPLWAQRINVVNPLAHLIAAVKMILVKGSTAADLGLHWVALACFAIVMGFLAVATFRKFKA
ncbi:MAG: ABC transporter permease [Rikenella sp.]|nr:ABC transporter permease [Rikenella sp.]